MNKILSLFETRDSITIEAISDVKFSQIDKRIIQITNWSENYPGRTKITVPANHKNEIIEKLMHEPGITSVDGKITEIGKQVQNEFKKTFIL